MILTHFHMGFFVSQRERRMLKQIQWSLEWSFNEKPYFKQKILVKSKLSLFLLFVGINIIKRGI
jgi:hypothetical protein